MTRPIVFATDYALHDEFVGVCHGVIARIAPGARVIDLTHSIRRQDVLAGALTLMRASRYMPEDAVWLGIVDPEVGAGRRAMAARTASGAFVVGPDNGLLSFLWRELGGLEACVEIESSDVVLQPLSRTFHGRDVFAPAAAHLALGRPLDALGRPVSEDLLLRLGLPSAKVEAGRIGCVVIDVDGFGNVELNVRPRDLEAAGLSQHFSVSDVFVRVAGTFSDVSEGEPLAVEDSQGFVAIAVNRGSAERLLGVREGDLLELS